MQLHHHDLVISPLQLEKDHTLWVVTIKSNLCNDIDIRNTRTYKGTCQIDKSQYQPTLAAYSSSPLLSASLRLLVYAAFIISNPAIGLTPRTYQHRHHHEQIQLLNKTTSTTNELKSKSIRYLVRVLITARMRTPRSRCGHTNQRIQPTRPHTRNPTYIKFKQEPTQKAAKTKLRSMNWS